MDDSTGMNVFRSYSDMMSGLLLLFILIMAVCLMQAQKNYTEKLAEQAKQQQTQTQLEQSQNTVDEQQDQLTAQQNMLDEQQGKLDEQASTLAEQAAALEKLQKELENQQTNLNQKESELDASQAKVDEQTAQIAQQESELADSRAQLADSQEKLDDANALMEEQQARIDQIVGVKADLIAALNQEFSKSSINVKIDKETGAILLDSSVMFELNESELTKAGQEVLDQVLPIYCQVLLSDKYKDYVAEVIIDGYTDTQGDYITNLDLSQNRAYAVASYLYKIKNTFLNGSQSKMLVAKLTANGKSYSNPILKQDGSVDMDASRRVEIKFRLKDEEMMAELDEIITKTKKSETAETAVTE